MDIFQEDQCKWGRYVFDIAMDDDKHMFVGTIRNILDRRVNFIGKDYETFRNSFNIVLEKYQTNPDSFPKTTKKCSLYKDIFTDEEINNLEHIRFHNQKGPKTSHNNLLHPLYALIQEEYNHKTNLDDTNRSRIAYNTDLCLILIKRKNFNFIKSIKKRLLDSTDYTQPLSALAELRAYGALCAANVDAQAIPCELNKNTPDFEVTTPEGKCLIEVHSKFSSYQDELQIPNEELNIQQKGNVRLDSVSIITPFGQPNNSKPNDSIATNMISKVCATKIKEKQFNADAINILWLDFQDSETLNFSCDVEHCLPYFIDTKPHAMPYTGCFWHAFYGKKGDPIIDEGRIYKVHEMMHDGRFADFKSKVNFAIISLPEALVVYENPNRSDHPDLPLVRKWFYSMPLFSVQHSIMNTHENIIQCILDIQCQQRNFCFQTFIDKFEYM